MFNLKWPKWGEEKEELNPKQTINKKLEERNKKARERELVDKEKNFEKLRQLLEERLGGKLRNPFTGNYGIHSPTKNMELVVLDEESHNCKIPHIFLKKGSVKNFLKLVEKIEKERIIFVAQVKENSETNMDIDE